MKLEIEVYSALCSTKIFKINDKDADYGDFVDKYDHSPDTAEDYCCGDMSCDTKVPTEKILKKYGITESEFDKIADELSSKLSWGSCGWCS